MRGVAVLSKKNPRVQAARELAREAKARSEAGKFLIEGPKLVREALAGTLELGEIFVSAALAQRDPGLAAELLRVKANVLEVDDDTLADLAALQVAQGVVAIARIPERSAQALLDAEGDLLLAATVQEPGNAGALVRIAAAAGFKGVIADLSTADFFSPKAVRGSAGAVLRLPALRVEDLAEFAGSFAWKGGIVLGAVPRGGENPATVALGRRVALVLGSEGQGIPPALLEACTSKVTIPMVGDVESLNVASAAAILAFEIRKRRE